MQCYIKGAEAPGSYTTGQLEHWIIKTLGTYYNIYSAKYKGPMHHIWVTMHNLLQVHCGFMLVFRDAAIMPA